MRNSSFAQLHVKPTSGRIALSSLKALLILALAAGAGCGSSTACPSPSLGHPEWSQEAPESTVPELHFGTVPVGNQVKRTATLTNSGSAGFTVDSMNTEGSTSFRIDFEPFVRPGESAEIPIIFEPGSTGPHAGRLVVKLGKADVPEIGLDLEGLGVTVSCEIEPPDTLDFGLVEISTGFLKQVKVINRSDLDWSVRIAPIAEDDGGTSFHFAEFEAGEHTVPAHGKLAITIEFHPERHGLHEAVLEVLAPCPHKVALVGKGAD